MHCIFLKEKQADVRDSFKKAHFRVVAEITIYSANVPNAECTSVSQHMA